MEAKSIVALMIIMGFWYWMSERSKSKTEQEATKEVQDDVVKAREETKATIHSRAMKFGIDYTDNQLDWICDEIAQDHGKEGLIKVNRMFKQEEDERLKSLFELIEKEYQNYLQDKEIAELKDAVDRKWRAILDDFKKLNPAQQKVHLDYIKKHSNELNEKQLHILELISLGDYSGPAETDVMVGDLKLFSMRRR